MSTSATERSSSARIRVFRMGLATLIGSELICTNARVTRACASRSSSFFWGFNRRSRCPGAVSPLTPVAAAATTGCFNRPTPQPSLEDIRHPMTEHPVRPAPNRLTIPSLRKLLEGRTPEDFRELRHPLADRTIRPDDLGTPAAAHRPDLVPVLEPTGGGPRLKMTAVKVWSGKIR